MLGSLWQEYMNSIAKNCTYCSANRIDNGWKGEVMALDNLLSD